MKAKSAYCKALEDSKKRTWFVLCHYSNHQPTMLKAQNELGKYGQFFKPTKLRYTKSIEPPQNPFWQNPAARETHWLSGGQKCRN
jgi:hypothetical protein